MAKQIQPAKTPNYKLLCLFATLIFGLWFSIPSFFDINGKKISLGLDLQGGLNLLLEVKSEEALKARFSTLTTQIIYESKKEKILIDNVKIKQDSIVFELIDREQKSQLAEILSKIEGLDIQIADDFYTLRFTEQEIQKIKDDALQQAIGTIRNRLDQFGLSEPSVTQQGKENILVQLPGIKSIEEEQRARDLIAKPAHLQMMAVDEARNMRVDSITELEAQKYGDVILPFASSSQLTKLKEQINLIQAELDSSSDEAKRAKLQEKLNSLNIEVSLLDSKANQVILLKEVPILDGSMLTDARVGYDQNNRPVVNFTLDSKGARIFGDFSGNNIGNRMAIVLDGKVYSAPVIRDRISSSGQISGDFTTQEASDLAIALKSGALPAPMEVLEKRSVGPSLGQDSIKASLIALVSGFLLVVLFMIIYYSFAGVIAVGALFVNILLIIAVMALFGASLTLPGMAGIVLTIGMAVDANIIINERIREALRAGNSIAKSIELGYANASRAIFDSNLTTLFAAILLYAFGSGAIKGFAITMGIGISASILTAIIGTHGIYNAIINVMKNKGSINFWFGIKLDSNVLKNKAQG